MDNILQRRAQHLFQPHQLVYGILAAAAKADALAGALIDGGIGIIAVLLIQHADHRHGIGGHTRHGTYGIVVMARFIFYLTAACQRKGFFIIFRQTFIFQYSNNGSAHGAAHLLPRNGWACMQQGVLVNSQYLMGRFDIHPVGLGVFQFIHGGFIGLPDHFLQIAHGYLLY